MLDAVHAALLAALMRDGTGCPPADLNRAVASATMQRLGAVAGEPVVLASVQAPCVCGNVNCPYYVLRGRSVLLSSFGYNVVRGEGAPLPELTIVAHNSALVHDETTYRFHGDRYVEAGSVMVRGSDGARKPVTTAVRFAPGASSAVVHGTVALGWDDGFVFAARSGQQLLVTPEGAPAVGLALAGPDGRSLGVVQPGKEFRLASTGRYTLSVQTDSERDVHYALHLGIR